MVEFFQSNGIEILALVIGADKIIRAIPGFKANSIEDAVVNVCKSLYKYLTTPKA